MNKLLHLPFDQIECPPQLRTVFDDEKQAELEASIRSVGLQQPVLVHRVGTRFVLLDGERRVRALRSLGIATVPVVVVADELTTTDIVQRQLVCNAQRSDLTPLEKARAIEALMTTTKWSSAQVAEKLGFSAPTVTRLLALLTLPEPIQAQVACGAISPSGGYELAQVGDPERQRELAQELAAGRITRDGVSGARRGKPVAASDKLTRRGSRATAMLGGGRSITITGAGLSLERVTEYLEELLAKLRKVRAQGLELPTFLKMLRDQAKAH